MKPSILIEASSISAEIIRTFTCERNTIPMMLFQRGLAGAEQCVVQLLTRDAEQLNDQIVEDAEDAWNEIVNANVTSTADAAVKKVGAASAKFVVAVGAVAGELLAAEAMSALDLSLYDQIKLWALSSVTTTAGQLQLLLDDTAASASPVVALDLPALTAATWAHCVLPYNAALAGLKNIISIGIKQVADLGVFTLNLDDVRAEQAWNDVVQGGTTLKLDTTNSLIRLDQPGQYRLKCLAAAGAVRMGMYG